MDVLKKALVLAARTGQKVYILSDQTIAITRPGRPANLAYEVYPGGRVVDWTEVPEKYKR